MWYIGIDLGSTNTKAAVYDENLCCVASETEPVSYIKDNDLVEVDVESYCEGLFTVLKRLAERPDVQKDQIQRITLAGQAETLLVLDKSGCPLMNAISWMDERSEKECMEIGEEFRKEEYECVTGQMAVLPTWPATKILWLKRNRPEVYEKAATYVLLKDYIVYRLTGKLAADCSVATFTFYFDIYNKCY
jgi:xylulokinase